MERINELEKEIAEMRKILYDKENELYDLKRTCCNQSSIELQNPEFPMQYDCLIGNEFPELPRWAIERYSRQILLQDIGVDGQKKICNAKVLIVGAGGLGCPAALYLAGAGVGEIGIVDYDTVDLTNLHRQVLHGEGDQGINKVDSAVNALRRINSNIIVTPYNVQLDSVYALEVLSKYDIVLDCSDNVPTRYMLNDACVVLKLPLVSGSALKMEGQLTVYSYRGEKNSNEKDPTYKGPCYRCLFPSPPPSELVGSCSSNGVAGPVPGLIGTLQALEAIKYIVGKTSKSLLVGRMLLFDGEDCNIRVVKLRMKSPQCAACSDNPTVIKLLDYEAFCKAKAKEKDLDLKILPETSRITPAELAEQLSLYLKNDKQRHLLVDVRSEAEFKMCHIKGAKNYPIDSLGKSAEFEKLLEDMKLCEEVTFLCRRGNDSQIVAKRVIDEVKAVGVKDLTGGLHAWSKEVDSNFPIY